MLLLVVLTGCRQQPPQPLKNGLLAPELEQARPAEAKLPEVFSMPARDVVDPMELPTVTLAESEATPEQTHRPTHRIAHPQDDTAEQEAANLQPVVSAIGNLSTGATDSSAPYRISAWITQTEDTLDHIHRTLTRQEQHTVAQIREFLKEARTALNSGDSDGAQTLTNKASILLRELHP